MDLGKKSDWFRCKKNCAELEIFELQTGTERKKFFLSDSVDSAILRMSHAKNFSDDR